MNTRPHRSVARATRSRQANGIRQNVPPSAPLDYGPFDCAGAQDAGRIVTLLQKPVPIGLLARCLAAEMSSARSGFWVSEGELVVSFSDHAIVCHPASVAELGCLLQEAELDGAMTGWIVEDRQDSQVWLELRNGEVSILRPPAEEVAAALQLIRVT